MILEDVGELSDEHEDKINEKEQLDAEIRDFLKKGLM